MRILVACEYSGIVRDAFSRLGHDAWSCDILPSESELTKAENQHIQGNVLNILCDNWDLMIGFPPCTYLSFVYTGKERYSIGRLQQKINAYQFFLNLWNAPIKHICLENPIGYLHTGLLPYTQIVEPYFFGDPYKKRTCLWLKNLPKLQSTQTGLFGNGTIVEPTHLLVNGSSKNKPPKLPELIKMFATGKEKSKFHIGIANAMAEQWTEYLQHTTK